MDGSQRPPQPTGELSYVANNFALGSCGAVLLAVALLPDAATAGGGSYVSAGYGSGPRLAAHGYVMPGFGFGIGYRYNSYPLDDSYDYPSGYGEYAEYGPWAFQGYSVGGCEQRRVRTAYGLRWRTVRLCN